MYKHCSWKWDTKANQLKQQQTDIVCVLIKDLNAPRGNKVFIFKALHEELWVESELKAMNEAQNKLEELEKMWYKMAIS